MADEKHKILIVDDEPQITRVLKTTLSSHGYSTRTAADGDDAVQVIKEWSPDLVITDLRMPNMDGLQLCRHLRAKSQIPIIVLSVRGEERTKVEALDAGADDYVTKPFSPRELLARVRAAIRRSSRAAIPSDSYRFDDVVVDFTRMQVTRDRQSVALTAQEFKTLAYLTQNPERAISREELLKAVWGYNSYPTTRTVDNHILRLRQKLERDPANPVHFCTLHGVGYQFVP